MCDVLHRDRFTIAAPVETPGVLQMRQVWKRVWREGKAADSLSDRLIGLPERIRSDSFTQFPSRRARRSDQRSAEMSTTGMGFA
jgi:hypothetical protein